MQRKRNKILSFLLIASLILTLGAGYTPASGVSEKAKAADGYTDLSQAEMVEAMGAGWNLGNQMEATDQNGPNESAWSHYTVEKSLIRNVGRAGFKSIRIPVSWLNLIGKAPDYTLNAVRLARVKEIIDWALEYKMYVIMNIHGDGYSTVTGGWLLPGKDDDAQVEIKAKYKAVWGQLADYFKDYDEHLIFESMNEVGADIAGKSDATLKQIQDVYKNINDYNQIFVDTVRQSGGNNDKRWVLIPGMNTDLSLTTGYDPAEEKEDTDYGFRIPEDTYLSKDVPEGQKRIMISVHYYAPWGFCGQEDYITTQWGDEADPAKSVGYQGEDYMERGFARLKEDFTSKGYPVVIGEYGSIDKSNTVNSLKGDSKNLENRKYYAWKLCSESKENGIVPVYWDNGHNGEFGFALFDRETFKVTQQDIIDGIMYVYGKNQKGNATGLSLSEHYLKMDTADMTTYLEATLTPDTSDDLITWSTSDSSVAKVTYKGGVMPRGVGICVITATAASGAVDRCVVEVTEPEDLKLGLYAGNSNTWKTLSATDYLTVRRGSDGGKYTISMTYDKSLMSKLNTLFLKDVTVQNGNAAESAVISMDAKLESVSFNGHACTLLKDTYNWKKDLTPKQNDQGEIVPTAPAVDLCFLNYWYEPDNIVSDVKKNTAGQCYDFPSDWYVTGDNTIEMTLTISNPVFEPKESGEKVLASNLALSNDDLKLAAGWQYTLLPVTDPAEANEAIAWISDNTKVATVDKNGVVTAVAPGETVIHAYTGESGQHVTCPVTVVAEDDGTLVSPTPQRTPKPKATPAPGGNTPAPGGNTTPAPGGNATPAPGRNTPAPGGNTTPAPGGNATPAPGTNVTPGTNNKPNTTPGKVTAPKKVTLKKVKSTKKKTLLVQWKKVSGATGYTVQIATDKKFKKGVKKYAVKGAKTTKKTIKKLKSKKKYFVRVSAYKKVSGKKYTGKWSSVKKTKIK